MCLVNSVDERDLSSEDIVLLRRCLFDPLTTVIQL